MLDHLKNERKQTIVGQLHEGIPQSSLIPRRSWKWLSACDNSSQAESLRMKLPLSHLSFYIWILSQFLLDGIDGKEEGQIAIVARRNSTLFDSMVTVCSGNTGKDSVKIGFAGVSRPVYPITIGLASVHVPPTGSEKLWLRSAFGCVQTDEGEER